MKLAGLALACGLLLSGCIAAPSAVRASAANATTATLHGDADHPAATQGWLRTELYFGTGLADRPEQGVSEAQWREFLDREVSTRFPSGLSVFDIYGQWRDQGAAQPERLRSKVIVLLHPDAPQQRADIEAIRLAWKRVTGDQSVLRVTQPADVSF